MKSFFKHISAIASPQKCRVWLITSLAVSNLLVLPTLPVRADISGKDGSRTVSTAGTVVNEYGYLTANATAGQTSITVSPGSTNGLNLTNLQPGDVLLIIQMQGATIDETDTDKYGFITSNNNAGNYEFVSVGSVNGNTINLASYCTGGLKNNYTATGKVQVIRVPQYSTLTVNSNASITAPAWDGTTGGIVTVKAETANINGSIDVTGKGFRGGVAAKVAVSLGQISYRSTLNTVGAEKGESIAGPASSLTNGRYGRGAPANGGGGGNNHNAAGGGGANGNNGNTYDGRGVMDSSTTNYTNAWKLETPSTIANSSGGGRGGYTYSSNNQDAITIAPGNTAWGGDNRRNVGGLGGRPLTSNSSNRLFFGGGGGAGDSNDANAGGSSGGSGGGLAYLLGNSVRGSGKITANGSNGTDIGTLSTNTGGNDAPGGAGGGGTVVVKATTSSGISIEANGGRGGNQYLNTNEAEGAGGGGGGGYIATTGGITTSAAGGANGTSTSPAVTEFLPNGGTSGATGQAINGTISNSFCVAPIISGYKSVKLTTDADSNTKITPGDTLTWTLSYANTGTIDVTNFQIADTLPTGVTTIAGTPPTISANTTQGTAPTANSSYNGTSNTNLLNSVITLKAGGVITVNIPVRINSGVTGTLSNQATASGTNLPAGAVRTDNVDSTTTGLPTGVTVPSSSVNQTQSTTSIDLTTVTVEPVFNISGTLYKDNNSNNTFDTGTDSTLPANTTVTLYKDANSNNTFDTGEQVASTTTDSSGNYTFANVANDTYKINVDTADTDIPPGSAIKTSNDLPVTVNGANITNQNFGFITLPSSFGSCDARPFIGYGSPTDTLGALNTNTLTLDTVGTTTTLYNAIGYNSANNLIYGIQRPTGTSTTDSNNLLAIGSNGVPVNLGAVSGLPPTNFYNAGDVGADGYYYVVDGNTTNADKIFYKIDINPTSPTYKRVVGQFKLSANYNSTNFFFGDIAFNPVDKQIYAVVNNSTTSQQLIKIDPSSGTAIAVGTATTTDTDNFIGLFVDRTGNIYGYQGTSRQMWRYNTATSARVLLANSLQTANSNADGTRCYDTPPIAPDLKISQTASSSRFAVGAANQSYTITVSIPATSTGITSAHGTITFTDQLPNGITIASTPTGTGWNCSASSGQTISCTYTGSLPVLNNQNLGGAITVPVNVAAAAVGTNKQSTATVPTLSAELNTSDNTATVAVDVVMSLNAQVLLVKRITAINGDRTKNPNDNTPLNVFVDDTASTRKDDDNNPMWKSNYLLGAIDAGKVKPGDEIEYTVYFLNPGGANANNVRLCDRITANQDFKVDAYGTSKDMQLQLGTTTILDLTRASDSTNSIDRAQFISVGGTVPNGCNLKATNNNGTLVIDVTGSANTGVPTLTALPGSTAQATPNDSYGYFRFITKVKP